MNNPLITIVTVTFNSAKTLERTIQSVINQKFKNFEYIIIDGKSTDGTVDIIKKYEKYISYWVSEPDKGIYDAMNKGIKAAKGDWIHLLNSDDLYYNEDALTQVSNVLKNEKENFYYFSMIQKTSDKEVYYDWEFNKIKLWYSAYLPHPTTFISKYQYSVLGLYDISFKIAADHDMILKLVKRFKAVHNNIPVTIMNLGGLSSQNISKTFLDFKNVTVKNGFNSFWAELIFRFKCFKYKILNSNTK